MFTGFNHIGIAVADIDQMIEMLKKQFAAVVIVKQEIPEANQVSALVAIGNDKLEIMAPLNNQDGGTVLNYLETHGSGLHHISMRTDDFDRDIADLEATGVKVFGKQKINGQKVAFAHPKTTGGILYELFEPAE